MLTPLWQPSSRIANESSGVGRKLSKRYTLMPLAEKIARVVAHVVAYDDTDLGHVGECLFEVVCQALGCSADGIDVHAVAAGTHDAAKAACAKFEVFVE